MSEKQGHLLEPSVREVWDEFLRGMERAGRRVIHRDYGPMGYMARFTDDLGIIDEVRMVRRVDLERGEVSQ